MNGELILSITRSEQGGYSIKEFRKTEGIWEWVQVFAALSLEDVLDKTREMLTDGEYGAVKVIPEIENGGFAVK